MSIPLVPLSLLTVVVLSFFEIRIPRDKFSSKVLSVSSGSLVMTGLMQYIHVDSFGAAVSSHVVFCLSLFEIRIPREKISSKVLSVSSGSLFFESVYLVI